MHTKGFQREEGQHRDRKVGFISNVQNYVKRIIIRMQIIKVILLQFNLLILIHIGLPYRRFAPEEKQNAQEKDS